MAENSVVKNQLTDAMVEAGAELVGKLDDLGLHATAALWLFAPESNEWRLMLASPDVSTRGPRQVYELVRDAIALIPHKNEAPLSVIGLLQDDAPFVRLLRSAIGTGPGIGRMRFSRNVINGHFIDDALIYRAER